MRPFLLLWLLLYAVAACGRPPVGDAGPRHVALELRPLKADAATASVERLHDLRPALGQDGWKVEGKARLRENRELAATAPTLILSAAEQPTVLVPGPFTRNSFNQVLVRLRSPGTLDLALELLLPGKTRAIGRKELRGRGEAESTVIFDIPAAGFIQSNRELPDVEGLRLRFLGGPPRIELCAIELLHKPWELFLPAVASGPELVMVGTEGRRAVGLTPQGPLACTLKPKANAQLHFACALPDEVPRTKGLVQVELVLRENERVLLRHKVPLTDPKGEGLPGWQGAVVDVSAFAGRTLQAHFALRVPAQFSLACALTPPYMSHRDTAQPTVLLITSDTHRGDHVGYADRGVFIETPTLDALAKSGTVFSDCYVSINATRPSHATLLTGTHPRDHGLLDNEAHLSALAPTLAEAFRDNGYLTLAVVSAYPVNPLESGFDQGFERYSRCGTLSRSSQDALDQLLAWLPDTEGVPLFAWLHVFDAHTPYTPPEDLHYMYFDRADKGKRPLPEGLSLGWQPRHSDLDFVAAIYKSEITGLDRELARLRAHPRLAQAITAFTADHGESLGAHEIYFAHAGLYEDTLHVPRILAGPGVPAGAKLTHTVLQTNLGRTLLDLAGMTKVPFPGHNLLTTPASTEPRFCIASNVWCASVTHGPWHLILHLRARSSAGESSVLQKRALHQVELYNLQDDPQCTRDLVREELEQARRLRAALTRWLLEAPAATWAEENQAIDFGDRQTLAALGYGPADEGAAYSALWDASCTCAECKQYE